MFGNAVMCACLALMAGIVPALVVVWLNERGIRPLATVVGRFRRLPLLARLVVAVLVADLIVYGSTKPSTNAPPAGVSGGMSGGGTNEPPSTMTLAVRGTGDGTRGFSADEIAAGVVQTWTRTGETWHFDPTPGATVVESWRKRGAADDWESVVTANFTCLVFSDGRIQDDIRIPGTVYAPLHAALGVVPEANWNRIAASNAASRVWYGESGEGTVSVTWQDVLLGRATNMPVSVQAEFDESGRFVYRYDLSHAEPDVLVGGWTGVLNNGQKLSASVGTNVTSIGWYRLHPEDAVIEDRDGDGLATRDEVFVHDTDPGRADTDCDGVPDGEEIARGLDPLDADSDHDGLVDGSDPAPLSPTPSDDLDGDGIPDAYETYWFGGTNVWNSADGRDATGFTLGAKLLAGMNPTNPASSLLNVSTNELASWKLWEGFSMMWPSGETNLVYERTVEIGRSNPLQQYYLSSEPGVAGAWRLNGLNLEVSWSGDSSGRISLTASPHMDSFRIPLGSNAVSSVTFRLRAAGPLTCSQTPVYLVAHAPRVLVSGGQGLVLNDGTKAYVFTDGSESRIGITVDRSKRPCRAPLSAEERDLSGLGDATTYGMMGFRYEGSESEGVIHADGVGVYDFPSFGLPSAEDVPASQARGARRSSAGRSGSGGDRLIVLLPCIGWHGAHLDGCLGSLSWDGESYRYDSTYPLDSTCLLDGWSRNDAGGRLCTCEPRVSSGLDGCPYVETTCEEADGKASGSVLVDGQVVWSGSAEHSLVGGWECADDLGEGGGCESCEGCEDGNCDSLEGLEVKSLKFRIPLGIPRKGQVSGFVYFDTQAPVRIVPATFECMFRGDSDVSVTTNGTDRTIVCSDERGRTLVITAIEDGVRVRITTTATGVHEHTWEILHVEGDLDVVRFRKVSRQNNTMEDWTAAYVYDQLEDGWRWQATDNIAGVREELVVDDRLNETEGAYTEYRDHYSADGAWLGGTVRRRERVGEGGAGVLRTTYFCETSPYRGPLERHATYWRDTEHRARNGRPRLVTGDDRAWEYHAWTENGYERLRLVQRNGGVVPAMFPEVDENGVLSGLGAVSNATLTVFGYDTLDGDSSHADENGRVRSETRYIVRNGVATCIGRIWHRFTHVLASGYAAVKEETWRAAEANADWNSPDNSYSYSTVFSESGVAAIPLALRGMVAERLDEGGVLSSTTVVERDGRVVATTRKTFDGAEFPEYEVVEYDARHAVELRHATCLAADGTVVDELTSVYDDQNRLRSRTWLDGSSLTNAFSCCRLLWSRDRQGRTVLRSAVTGEDHLYWAEEDTWLGDPRLRGEPGGTNGSFRVTQHFGDAFGRETNRVVYTETTAGRAVDWTASSGAEKTMATTDFYGMGASAAALRVDARGKATMTSVAHGPESDETTEDTWWDGGDLTEKRVRVRNGVRVVRKSWSDKNTETASWTDYDANGCRIETEVTTSDDCGIVTNRVARYDFLGRRVALDTPEWTTTYAYLGSSSRRVGSVRSAGGVSVETAVVHDVRGEAVGSVENGVCTRRDIAYENVDGGWWRVTRDAVFSDGVTNSVAETREQLTGLGAGVRKRDVLISADGITQETVVVANADGTETTTVSNALSGVVVTTNLFGLVLSRTTADGTRRYAYDAHGRLVGEMRLVGGEVRPVRDVGYALAGDVAFVRTYTNATDGVMESYAFDARGNRTSVTDALGGVVTVSYDAMGRETSVGGTAAYAVRYGYDTQGRRTLLATSRDGAAWDATVWTYESGTGRMRSKRYADGGEMTFAYTADGLAERVTQPSGAWRSFGYDRCRRRVAMASSDGSADAGFAYDIFGRKTSESNAVFTASYLLAKNGLATNECQMVWGAGDGGTAHTFVRTLDGLGRISRRGFSDGVTQTISYTSENRIASVSTPDVSVAYAYGADGGETGYTVAVAGGVTVRRVVVRDPYRGTVTAVSNIVNGSCVRVQTFAYDALGRVIGRDGDMFAYNARGELAGFVPTSSASGASVAYSYDGVGNFMSVVRDGSESSFSANAVNQYGGLPYTLDGGLAGYGDAEYAYDAAGRLESVATGGVCAATYAYDPQGRRVRKTTSGSTHLYFYDGWNLVREEVVTADRTETVDYFWGRDLGGTLDATGGVGGLVYLKRDGSIYIPLYDANGSIVAYLDGNGSAVAEFVYDGFGNCLSATGSQAASCPFRHSTRYEDSESGLVYYGLRHYLPALGRWLTRDPLEERGGLNLYSFCGNNAVNSVDLFGGLNALTAFLHYLGRGGEGEVVPLGIIDTSSIRGTDFPQVGSAISSCEADEHPIDDVLGLDTGGTSLNLALMLGNITLQLSGYLVIEKGGDWSLSADLTAAQDTYDFNKGNRPFLKELLTTIGRNLPGVVYTITIEGSRPILESGNCCRAR